MNYLTDGFATLISLAVAPSVHFREIDVTPPEVQAGAIDQTTMRNTAWKTTAPKTLKTLGDVSLTVAYDPVVLNDIETAIGQNNLITLTHPDGSTWAFWGWLDSFKPSSNKEGARPEASVTLKSSNTNASGVEVAPVYTA